MSGLGIDKKNPASAGRFLIGVDHMRLDKFIFDYQRCKLQFTTL